MFLAAVAKFSVPLSPPAWLLKASAISSAPAFQEAAVSFAALSSSSAT